MTQSILDDDTSIPDDDLPEEWLAQVFEVAALRARNKRTLHNGCWANQRHNQIEQRS
jgi:hypothetical protein